MGYIYIIRNTVNDKVYIGQTIQSLKNRFKGHIFASVNGSAKINKAMRQIGADKFSIEVLCECSNKELNKLETEYIAKYDSYYNGYNSTQGGAGGEHNELYEEELSKQFEEDYKNITLTELCIKYKVSETFVYSILNALSINYKKDIKYKYNNENIQVVMYSKTFEPLCMFNSIIEALKYCRDILSYKVNTRNGYGRIKAACQNNNIAYGHRWQLYSELMYDNKIFRTKFDKDAYINGKLAYQPKNKKYWVVDEISQQIKENLHINSNNICKFCGKKISSKSNMCMDCYNEQRKCNIPSKNELCELINSFSYEEIGKQFGVSGKAVRKWCDSYGISSSSRYDSSGVVCVELNIKFNTFKEAAEYLINNNYSNISSVNRLSYNISQAKKENKIYLGFHWK